jgi:hypothetical protein
MSAPVQKTGSAPRKRAARGEPLADFLAAFLSNRGQGVHVAELHVPVIDWLISTTLARDERFVEVPGHKWELVKVRDARHEAVTREPEPVEGEEWAPAAESYVVPSSPTGEVMT